MIVLSKAIKEQLQPIPYNDDDIIEAYIKKELAKASGDWRRELLEWYEIHRFFKANLIKK